ncbi:UbiA prenyltransferase family protein [Winogradskyella sp.]
MKYFGVAKFHHRSLAGWLKTIQIFSFFAFLALCYFVLGLSHSTLICIAVLAVITFLYAIPILPMRYFRDKKKNLRQISGLKVYVIAFVWTFTTVILPLLANNIEIDTDVIVSSLQRYILVIVLMLPFEIRDLNFDSLKLGTIPQRIGIKNTKIIGVVLLLVFFLLEFFKDDLTTSALLSSLGIIVLTLLFLVFSHRNQSKYYSAFWVESIPIFWLVFLLMFN